MIHELLCIGNRRVDEPDGEHEKEEDQKNEFPPPFFLQLAPCVITAVNVIPKEQYKGHECELHRNTGKAAITR